MESVYGAVESLQDHELVGSGECVELIKAYAPGLQGLPTSAWKPGRHVLDVANQLRPGTAIATFVDGKFPRHNTGQHAAFYLRSDPTGIWVMDQWAHDKKKPTVSKRHIRRRGKFPNGAYISPSNNAEAFFTIER